MTVVAALLARAVAAHRAGRVTDAASIYRDVLAVEPEHPRACHLLGFALLQMGTPADAVPFLVTALRRAPHAPNAWAHLGVALTALGQPQPATRALRRALLLAPALEEAATGLIQVARDAGRPVAERVGARAVILAPRRAIGWHALGLARAGRAFGTEAPDDGIPALRRAVIIDPSDRPSVADLADALRTARDPQTACLVGRWAIRVNPLSTAARSTLAATLFDLDRVEQADRAARGAAVLSPGNARAYGNRAQCLYRIGRFPEAVVCGSRAATIEPAERQICANLASYHLALGDLGTGWRLFGHRPSRRVLSRAPGLPAASWAGEPGARLLVLAEQGLGDELLFATCWPDLARRVREGRLESVLVELDARLRPLAERSFPELQWLERERTEGVPASAMRSAGFRPTHWTAAGDLPSVFRRRVEEFPAAPEFLAADPVRVAGFRRWLDSVAPGLPRLGLCWRSGLRTGDRLKHYPSLAECRPLLRLPHVRIVVLQYDDCAAEVAAESPGLSAPLLIPPNLDRRDDLDGVAALITALDGVISAETAVLALAGATGAPTVGFGLGPGWVALGRPRAPWYPTVGSVHRRVGESWDVMMERVAAETGRLIGKTKEPGDRAARLD